MRSQIMSHCELVVFIYLAPTPIRIEEREDLLRHSSSLSVVEKILKLHFTFDICTRIIALAGRRRRMMCVGL